MKKLLTKLVVAGLSITITVAAIAVIAKKNKTTKEDVVIEAVEPTEKFDKDTKQILLIEEKPVETKSTEKHEQVEEFKEPTIEYFDNVVIKQDRRRSNKKSTKDNNTTEEFKKKDRIKKANKHKTQRRQDKYLKKEMKEYEY